MIRLHDWWNCSCWLTWLTIAGFFLLRSRRLHLFRKQLHVPDGHRSAWAFRRRRRSERRDPWNAATLSITRKQWLGDRFEEIKNRRDVPSLVLRRGWARPWRLPRADAQQLPWWRWWHAKPRFRTHFRTFWFVIIFRDELLSFRLAIRLSVVLSPSQTCALYVIIIPLMTKNSSL